MSVPRHRCAGAPVLITIIAFMAMASTPVAMGQRIPRGKWRANDEPEGWTVVKTRNYQVQTQVARERARLVVDHVESMMHEYYRRFRTRKPLKDFVLKIFKARRDYSMYAGSGGSLAFYSDATRELVCFDTGALTGKDSSVDPAALERTMKRLRSMGLEAKLIDDAEVGAALALLARPQLLGVLAHEAWHQYFHFWIVSKVDFPSWLDEGLGDYFYTAQVSEDGAKITCGILNPMRFPTIWTAIKQGKHIPIKELIRYRRAQYYRNPGLCYAEGWSLVYFCYHGDIDRYRQIPDKLIRVFKDKHNMDKATEIAFRGIDLDEFEKEWIDFYMSMDFKETLKGMVRDLVGVELGSNATPLTTPKQDPGKEVPPGSDSGRPKTPPPNSSSS